MHALVTYDISNLNELMGHPVYLYSSRKHSNLKDQNWKEDSACLKYSLQHITVLLKKSHLTFNGWEIFFSVIVNPILGRRHSVISHGFSHQNSIIL